MCAMGLKMFQFNTAHKPDVDHFICLVNFMFRYELDSSSYFVDMYSLR